MDSTEILAEVIYPESDGKPMADNMLQWDWIVKIVGELRAMFRNQEVLVAGDIFWYPVKGEPRTVIAPDVLVAFGRPQGLRGSYKQWEEGDTAPQVVFEVLSPANTTGEMDAKLEFYEHYGVEEFYILDPDENALEGYVRRGDRLFPVRRMNGYVSPRLGVRFELNGEIKLYGPDGKEFQTREEYGDSVREELARIQEEREAEREELARIEEERKFEQLRADHEQRRAEKAEQERETQRQLAEQEKQLRLKQEAELARLKAKLQQLGLDEEGV